MLHVAFHWLPTFISAWWKISVDANCLSLKMSSQLHSVFIWVQAVAHLLLSWFRVTSLVQSKFLAKYELGCKWKSFCNCIFLPKRGGSWYTHVILNELRNYSCTLDELLGGVYATIHANLWKMWEVVLANVLQLRWPILINLQFFPVILIAVV